MIVLGAALVVFGIFFGIFAAIAVGHSRFREHNLRPPSVEGPHPAPEIGTRIVGMVCLWAAVVLLVACVAGLI